MYTIKQYNIQESTNYKFDSFKGYQEDRLSKQCGMYRIFLNVDPVTGFYFLFTSAMLVEK